MRVEKLGVVEMCFLAFNGQITEGGKLHMLYSMCSVNKRTEDSVRPVVCVWAF